MFLSLLQFFFLVFRSAQFLRFNSQFQHFFQNLCDSILIFFVSLLKSAFILNFLRFNTHFFISARFSDNLTFQTHKTQIRNFGVNSAMTCNGLVLRFVRLENRRFFGRSKSLVECLSVRYLV